VFQKLQKGEVDMVLKLKMRDIINKLHDTLQASNDIRDYCMAKYDTAPKIVVGTSVKRLFLNINYPQIILYPGAKQDDLKLHEYTYKLAVKWTIFQSKTFKTSDKKEYLGVTECDELGQLIYMSLPGLCKNSSINKVSYSLVPGTCYPRFPGWMDITLRISADQ